MNPISVVTQSNLAKFVAPIRTALEVERSSESSNSNIAAQTAQKTVSSINVKGSIVNKTL